MPNRILRAEILRSETVDQLSIEAELFYRRLMSVVDDHGRYYANVTALWTAAFPLKADRISREQVEAWLEETISAGLILVYEVSGKRYMELQNFKQQTRVDSKFPVPPSRLNRSCAASDAQVNSKQTANEHLVGVGVGVGDECEVGDEVVTCDAIQPSKKKVIDAEKMVLPESLNNPTFRTAIAEFIAFKAESKPLSRYALQLVITDCERVGAEKATAAVNLALKSGWMNIHFDAVEKRGPPFEKMNGHATKTGLIGTGNDEWKPPSEEDVVNYALSKKKVAGFGRYCWNLWNGNNWKHFGEPIKNDRQWRSLLLTIEWKGR